MVCQVALTDGRIILPTVKNSGGTLGHFACCLQMLPSKLILVSQLFLFSFFNFFAHILFCLFQSQTVFSLVVTVATEPMAQEWNLITLECYINQVIIVHKVFIMTRPSLCLSTRTDPSITSWNMKEKKTYSIFSFSLSHLISYDASEHDRFPCVIYTSPEAKFI